jgi:hypothetical protein
MKHQERNFLFIGIILLSVFLSSCKEDEEKPDLGTQISGTYDYRAKYYIVDGSELAYLGSDFDEIGTAIVSKTSTGFEMKEGGEVVFRGAKLAEASNGITFDIESQSVDIDGDNVLVEGYDGFELAGVKYNGMFETSPKKLTGYFQFESTFVDENEDAIEVTFVIEVVGSKI